MTGGRSVVAAVAAFVVLALGAGCSGGEPEAGPTTPVASRDATPSPSVPSSPAPPAITCGNLLDNFPEEVYEEPSMTRASDEVTSETSWSVCLLRGKAPDGRTRGGVTVSIERALTPPDGGLRRWGRDNVDHEINDNCGSAPRKSLPGYDYGAQCSASGPDPAMTLRATAVRGDTWASVNLHVSYSGSSESEARSYATASATAILDVIFSYN